MDKIIQGYLDYEQKIKGQISWLNGLSAKALVDIILREAEGNPKLPHSINRYSFYGTVVEFKIREWWQDNRLEDEICLLSNGLILRTRWSYHGSIATLSQESEYSEIEGLCCDLVKFITYNGIYAMGERFNDRTDKLIAEM